jgi:uncharacterized protein (TIGR02271 family)
MTSHERHILGQHEEHDQSNARVEESGATVQLREEELAPRKHVVEGGRVSVGTDVVEEQQTLEVPITREEVTIDRQPVERRPSPEPVSASRDELSVPVREEQVSVSKQPVIYEEVGLGKRAVQETQHVSDTVRKEVVDVDATGEVDVRTRGRGAGSV